MTEPQKVYVMTYSIHEEPESEHVVGVYSNFQSARNDAVEALKRTRLEYLDGDDTLMLAISGPWPVPESSAFFLHIVNSKTGTELEWYTITETPVRE